MPEAPYDAVIIVSFGGPEGPEDVDPFLDNVLRGREVPAERRQVVAGQYLRFGGKSPINGHNRALVAALQAELDAHGPPLPVYWGNRNWHPMLPDTVRRMRDDGVRTALAFVTSAFASLSGCRQYLDDLDRARAEVGPGAPVIDKLRLFYNHPGFVEPQADRVAVARDVAGVGAPILFSAHSIPISLAATCDYEAQLTETARLVAELSGGPLPTWQLVYQSRSGPPSQPWLGPDVRDALRSLAGGHRQVVVAPIGFTSDHQEVVFDLDTQAAETAAELGLTMFRAATVGADPRFVTMIRQLVEERMDPATPRLALGRNGPAPDRCPPRCCPAPLRPGRPPPVKSTR